MKDIPTTPAGLAAALGAMAPKVQRAAEAAMRENARDLLDKLNTDRKEAPEFIEPGAWVLEEIDGGAIVGNPMEQARWAEQGRSPGSLPHAPIRAWVERHAASWRQAYEALLVRKGGAQGRGSKGKFVGHKDERERAIASTAFALQTALERDGIAPRWTLRRALESIRGRMMRRLARSFRGVTP